MESGRLKHAVRGAVWNVAIAQASTQVVAFAVVAVLCRLVSPEEFGLVYMVLLPLVFLRTLSAMGLGAATIQRPELSPGDISALFWLSQAMGLAASLLAAALSPGLVWFYGTRDVGPLSVAMAATPLVIALGAQHQALLERDLRLGALAVARLVSQIVGGAAGITAAVADWGVWALVVQHYAELLALDVALWIAIPWRPGRPLAAPLASGLVRFGGLFTASSLLLFVAQQVDKLLIGVLLGQRALGLYNQAYNLMAKPVSLVCVPLIGILLPALSRAHGNRETYASLLAAFYRLLAVFLFPCGVGLAIVAPEAVELLLGPDWREAGPILRVLSLAILVQGFFNAAGSVFTSAGRVDRLFAASCVVLVVLLLGSFAGLEIGRRFGQPTLGVACSYTIGLGLIVFPPYMLYCLRVVEVPVRSVLPGLGRSAWAALGMAFPVLGCRYLLAQQPSVPVALSFALQVAVGILSYLWLARGEIHWFRQHWKKFREDRER